MLMARMITVTTIIKMMIKIILWYDKYNNAAITNYINDLIIIVIFLLLLPLLLPPLALLIPILLLKMINGNATFTNNNIINPNKVVTQQIFVVCNHLIINTTTWVISSLTESKKVNVLMSGTLMATIYSLIVIDTAVHQD